MPPVPDRRQQARLGQIGEMGAGGLRRDARRVGQLTGSERAAIEKRREHRGSRRLPDERRNRGDERACNHLPSITPGPVQRLWKHFDGDRSCCQSKKVIRPKLTAPWAETALASGASSG